MTLTTLLTLDGTDKDERALAVGAGFAELAGGNVRVVRVFNAQGEARGDVMEGMRVAASRLDAQIGHCATWAIIDSPDVAAALLDDIALHRVDFVVMATRAARAIDRAIHGSVAGQLVRESPCAILLVPPQAEHLRDDDVQLRRVLVPLDGSPAAETVITRMLELPLINKLEFVLLEAVEPERTGGNMLPPGVRTVVGPAKSDKRVEWINVQADVAEQRLEGVAERLRARGATVDVRVVEAHEPGDLILEVARDELVDFIAMTTRGEGGLRRLVLGSVAEHVVRSSDLPVLLVSPRARAAPRPD